jgi:hypothetical protein
MPEKWPETLKKRYVDVGKSVLTALSIPHVVAHKSVHDVVALNR